MGYYPYKEKGNNDLSPMLQRFPETLIILLSIQLHGAFNHQSKRFFFRDEKCLRKSLINYPVWVDFSLALGVDGRWDVLGRRQMEAVGKIIEVNKKVTSTALKYRSRNKAESPRRSRRSVAKPVLWSHILRCDFRPWKVHEKKASTRWSSWWWITPAAFSNEFRKLEWIQNFSYSLFFRAPITNPWPDDEPR